MGKASVPHERDCGLEGPKPGILPRKYIVASLTAVEKNKLIPAKFLNSTSPILRKGLNSIFTKKNYFPHKTVFIIPPLNTNEVLKLLNRSSNYYKHFHKIAKTSFVRININIAHLNI